MRWARVSGTVCGEPAIAVDSANDMPIDAAAKRSSSWTDAGGMSRL
jgi:hypothetical protein